MEDHENLYDKIKELFGTAPGSFNIMEDTIDVDLQMEYFEFSKKMAGEIEEEWAMERLDNLDDPDVTQHEKRQLLARLATVEDVLAYRAIERYMEHPDPELREWTILALRESRMHMESDLLEENQVFISTGLGGKGTKLRYFVVLIARNREMINETQQKIIRIEFPEVLKRFNGEVEEIESSGYLSAITLLLPIQYPVKQVFNTVIETCNQYGDFLREHFIVTNVRKLSFEEIVDFIELRGKEEEED